VLLRAFSRDKFPEIGGSRLKKRYIHIYISIESNLTRSIQECPDYTKKVVLAAEVNAFIEIHRKDRSELQCL